MTSQPFMHIPIEPIISQHAEEAAFLWSQRQALTSASHVSLQMLARHDERIAAHIDGLRIAGEVGLKYCAEQLKSKELGGMFAAFVLRIEQKSIDHIETLLALTKTLPAAKSAIISALGWASARSLQGIAKHLLTSDVSFNKEAGIAACAMHQVDPGFALVDALQNDNASLRREALKTAGLIHRSDVWDICNEHLQDKDKACAYWAASSSILLGDKKSSLTVLKDMMFDDSSPFRRKAMQVLLKLIPLVEAHELLKQFSKNKVDIRLLIEGAGVSGDPAYCPWLIDLMSAPVPARLAGEAFTFITGLDISREHFATVENTSFNEASDNDDIQSDEDDHLPWPDPEKIKAWWNANQQRFQNGSRYFMGQPLSLAHCKQVLQYGYQRQRSAAAYYLSVLQPGTMLFSTNAPAWRQKRWMEKLD